MRKIPILVVSGVVLASLATTFAKDWHQNISFEAACKKAAAEKKLVFIDFFTTWCAPCKMMDASTFKDPTVAEWLNKHTVPLKIDAEKEVALAGRYRIDSYPTLLFLKPDGTEVDRLLGYVTTEQLITDGAGILQGKNAVTRAREALEKGDASDPVLRMKLGSALASKGKLAEALDEYLWCLDHGFQKHPEAAGARDYVLMETMMLGQRYPKAIMELFNRRDQARSKLLEGKADANDIMTLAALNRAFGEAGETVKLYERLRTQSTLSTELKQALIRAVLPQLLEARRYADVAADLDIMAAVNAEFARYDSMRKETTAHAGGNIPKEQRSEREQALKGMLIYGVSGFYQVLIGLSRHDDAARVADRLLKYDASAETYNALAWSGYLTGKPAEANVRQARKAYELSGGQDISIIDTLARVLYARGRKPEAVALAKEGLSRAADPAERAFMERCLADFR